MSFSELIELLWADTFGGLVRTRASSAPFVGIHAPEPREVGWQNEFIKKNMLALRISGRIEDNLLKKSINMD